MSTTFDSNELVSSTSVALPVPADASGSLRFYRAVWRWHFYAGLFVIPFLLILAVTGIIQLFKPQLDSLMYGPLIWVHPSGEAQPYTQQLAAVKAAYPDDTVLNFRAPEVVGRSSEVAMSTVDEHSFTVFVNPYTSAILGTRDDNNSLQAVALKIHGNMLIGDLGDRILELAACWGIVLTITGLYLWWPRKGIGVWGTVLPRLKTKNKRTFWRDLHAVSGFWGAALVLFFFLTGLPWTGFWGDQFAHAWSGFPTLMYDNIPQSTQLTGSLNTSGSKVVPWAVEKMPMPESDPSSAHAEHQSGGMQMDTPMITEEGIAPGMPVDLDAVIALGKARGAPDGFLVSLPDGETGVYTVTSPFPTNATQEVTLHVDQYSGRVLADVRWKDYGLMPKLVEGGTTFHMGGWFGLPNQLLMLFGCLIVILLCVGGVMMWWIRRPANRLGAPAMPKSMPQVWKGFIAILLLSGLAFPLLGGSLLVMLVLDNLVISRIPVLKQALN